MTRVVIIENRPIFILGGGAGFMKIEKDGRKTTIYRGDPLYTEILKACKAELSR